MKKPFTKTEKDGLKQLAGLIEQQRQLATRTNESKDIHLAKKPEKS